MSQIKKYTQTKLSFIVKPKSEDVSPKVQAPTTKKRPRLNPESQEDKQKKLKLNATSKPIVPVLISDQSDAAGEPEVSSSSEPVQSIPASKSASSQPTLEPILQLKRCDTPPKIEVTSSTSAEDLDLSVGLAIEDGTDPASIVLSTADTESNSTEKCELTSEGHDAISQSQSPNKSTMSPCKSAMSPCKSATSSADVSVDPVFSPSQVDTTVSTPQAESGPVASSSSQRSVSKRISTSAQKHRDEQRAALEQKRKELEMEKEKKRLQRLEEKLQREKEVEEKKRVKAEQKEAEKEKRRLQKEALQAQKQAELDAKNAVKEAERQKKEEEKQKRDEEKKQKELERIRLEEEKAKKRDAQKNVLLNYFQKSSKKEEPKKTEDSEDVAKSRFKPFAVKADMRLAPIRRVDTIDVARFDKAFHNQSLQTHVYLSELKSSGARRSQPTGPWIEEDDDVVTVVPGGKRLRAKFLQFHTDLRPAYFGTWRKKSRFISARHPLAEDKERFNYEEDSADEWEEEEPGESVDSGDEDEEEKDEFDFDPELREDGFLVDHNYLSDDEGGISDEEEESLAAKKTKHMIARTYGKRNRKKNRLRPVVCGTIWQGENNSTDDVNSRIKLQQFSAIIFHSLPIDFSAPIKKSPQLSDSNSQPSKKLRPVPEEALPEYIKMIHGCVKSAGFIMKRFQEAWEAKTSNNLSKRQMKLTLQSMATYKKKENHRPCWYVKEEILIKHGLQDLPAPDPIYAKTTPVVKPRPSPSQNVTPPAARSVNTPDSSQKRLTDFTQPAKKKLKISELLKSPAPSPSQQQRKVMLITLDDSPQSLREADTAARTPNPELKSSPRRISLTTLSSAGNEATPTSKSTPSSIVPRRVGITTLQSENTALAATQPVLKAQSPRRVKLTTLSTPTKPDSVNPSTTNKATPGASPQTNKSPRRVNFTTLGKLPPSSSASSPSKTLSERSQNTQKQECDTLPLKTSVL